MKLTSFFPNLKKSPFPWENLGHRLGLLIFLFLVFGPLLALLGKVIFSWGANSDGWWATMLPSGRRLVLLLRSAGLAGGVALGGVVLGILTASYLWGWQKGFKARLRWFFLLSAPIPPYIHALAWTSTLEALNRQLSFFGLSPIPLSGWFISWWVQLMALLPLATALALLGLESVEADFIEVSRLFCPDIKTLAQVMLPLAKPLVTAGGALLFLLTLVDYSVPSLFSVNVYPLEIFAEYSANNDPAKALLLALPLILLTTAVVVVSQSSVRKAASLRNRRRIEEMTKPLWPPWFLGLQWLALLILGVQLLIPLVSLGLKVGSWNNFSLSIGSAQKEIFFSLVVAGLSALLGLPPALAAAGEFLDSSARSRFWWLMVTIPLAVSAPLVGIGLIALWNPALFPYVYGSWGMPVLAGLARFMPLAAIVIWAQLRRVDPLLLDAARLLQTHPGQTWLRVRLPMLAPGLLAAAVITFILTAGELGATLMVAPPGRATLTMRIYNYLHYGASSEVAGLGLMMVIMAMAATLVTLLAVGVWGRIWLRE